MLKPCWIFYAEIEFHWNWLRDKLKTASRSPIQQKWRKFRRFWTPGRPKCDFRKMNFNLHWPEVFFMLKPNFICIGWEINSGQLADLQFTKNGDDFGVFGPLNMWFSQNGLQLAVARGIFYAETKFHWYWLRGGGQPEKFSGPFLSF